MKNFVRKFSLANFLDEKTSTKDVQTLQSSIMKFLNIPFSFFSIYSFFGGPILACLDPDPLTQFRRGIPNTDFSVIKASIYGTRLQNNSQTE
jgi:hypothetical protein